MTHPNRIKTTPAAADAHCPDAAGSRKGTETRREFLVKSSVAFGAATIVPRHVLGGPGTVAPSDRVNVALVGAGGRGLQNARELLKLPDVRITTIADPAERWDLSGFYYRGVSGRVPTATEIESHYRESEPAFQCRQFEDYRDMLQQAGDDLDAVLCATPDHLHANVSLDSMRSGKHVYCEKPLTHNIAEARLVASVAKETGVATQMGNQGHSSDSIREAVELVRSGVLGDVDEVHAWVQTSRWNATLQHPPSSPMPLPKGLNWDLWCGPREPVAYHSAYAPVSWRDFWKFGCGALGDMGCHDLDATVWAFGLEHPTRVEFRPAGDSDDAMAPFGEIGYYDFNREGSNKPLRVAWYSGGIKPATPEILPPTVKLPNRGSLFVGSKGVMLCGGAGRSHELFPLDLRDSVQLPEASIARSNGHHRDWIDAIKGGPPASSNFEYGAKLTEIVLLGLLALRTGEIIRWDADLMKARNVESADAMVHESYRDGWGLKV